jgi:hypothetical protein
MKIILLGRQANIFGVKISKVFFGVFFLSFFLLALPGILRADTLTANDSVTISARVVGAGGGGGGGSGGGSGGEITTPTIVNFSGMGYPLSKIYILKNGEIAVTTIADPGANFSVSLTGLSTDTYTFSVYGEDKNGRKSSSFSFPIYITAGTIVNIGNIFISPTIDIDKSEVKKGDTLIIFGQTVPESAVSLSVHSDQEYFYHVASNKLGAYLYNLDTSFLQLGKHQTKSKSSWGNQVSPYTLPVSFLVGDENKKNENEICSFLTGDFNCDGHVNLIDFSIMAFWYKKTNPPAKIDLSGDTKINLVDFSILAFHWTG